MDKLKAIQAIGIETYQLTKRFGSLTALDQVSLKVSPGSLHALLGENGAGKSTLVKCLMGFYKATSGQIIVNDKEIDVPDPRAAHALGLGMVYQHFTLVPSLTAAENLTINRPDCPRVIRWRNEQRALEDFLESMPFKVPMNVAVQKLAAGQKQKLEIIKQLYLGSRFLILDEPTSVLTPDEAVEVLHLIRDLCEKDRLTVLMITHKFREVSDYADTVSVLRHGRYVGGGSVKHLSHQALADMMMGEKHESRGTSRKTSLTRKAYNESIKHPVLELKNIRAQDKSNTRKIKINDLSVMAGEIVGVAGISGNGQSEFMEILTGQRPVLSGQLAVNGAPFKPSRQQSREEGVRYLPEEPLHNASAARMSVTENISLRTYDENKNGGASFWLDRERMRQHAYELVRAFNVKAVSLEDPIESLSGGNIQRAVLARELTGNVRLLIVSNPCFGLDFVAVTQIRQRILDACAEGTAVLLISEDLDEILELSDRVVVMSEGSIVYQCDVENADSSVLGHYMAGQIAVSNQSASRENSSTSSQ